MVKSFLREFESRFYGFRKENPSMGKYVSG